MSNAAKYAHREGRHGVECVSVDFSRDEGQDKIRNSMISMVETLQSKNDHNRQKNSFHGIEEPGLATVSSRTS